MAWTILKAAVAQFLLYLTVAVAVAIVGAFELWIVGVVSKDTATDVLFFGIVINLVLLLSALSLDEECVQVLPF